MAGTLPGGERRRSGGGVRHGKLRGVVANDGGIREAAFDFEAVIRAIRIKARGGEVARDEGIAHHENDAEWPLHDPQPHVKAPDREKGDEDDECEQMIANPHEGADSTQCALLGNDGVPLCVILAMFSLARGAQCH